MVPGSVFGMDSAGFVDVDEAFVLVDSALAAVGRVRDGEFWKLLPEQQLELGRRLEMLARTLYAVQLHQTGEIDAFGLAATQSCSSTAALLRQAFTIGRRSASSGLTPIRGLLDDDGVEVLSKAIDGLAAPRPEAADLPDLRPAANRRAHALVEALRRFLDAGLGPISGGERPHVTVTMRWDALTGLIGNAGFDSGALIGPAQARKFLCDAQVVPMVLGGGSEVLDVGRSMRSFPAHIRRAITARDRGCVWPGCDRPPDWCDAHHIKFWRRDFGDTSYGNGCLLCPYHPSTAANGSSSWLPTASPNSSHPPGSTPPAGHAATPCAHSTPPDSAPPCPEPGERAGKASQLA
jgi:hypothetical protein